MSVASEDLDLDSSSWFEGSLFISFLLSDEMQLFSLTLALRASNVSHTVVLRPLKAGYFNFTSATITYLAQEGGQVVVSWLFIGSLPKLDGRYT